MATISEITQGASYRGDANLGGGFIPAITLDTKPIEDLAKYTFLYNKSEYDQRQIDAEKAANEIADYTSYDLTSGIPKDAKYLQDKYDKITAYVREHPDALNYRNKKEWADYKVMRNGLDDDVRSGKVRSTLFMARQEEINNEKNPAEKARLQANLEKEVAATDIRTPLQHTNKFDVEQVQYVAPKKLSFTVSKEFPNYLSETDVLTTDMGDLKAQSRAIVLGLSKFTNPQTPLEQQQYEAQANTGKLEPILSAQSLSAVMAPYMVNGVFDVAAAKKSGNSILAGNIANVEAYNQRMRDMKAAIKSEAFQDKLSGGVAAFGVNGLNENDYSEIDLNKGGITSEELVDMRLMGMSQNTQSKTDIKPTDNQIQKMQIGETARHNKAQEGLGWEGLNFDKLKWTTAMTGGETVKNGAVVFSEKIYGDLKKLADANGVISPDKARQLNQEQLKYLGIEKLVTNEDGTSAPKSVFSPLSIGDNDAIQVINGEIKILANAKLRDDGKGWRGTWDNGRSTTISNIATNRLNEELKNAGAKELNSYLPVDLSTGEISTNQIGGGVKASGGAAQKTILKTTKSGAPVFKN